MGSLHLVRSEGRPVETLVRTGWKGASALTLPRLSMTDYAQCLPNRTERDVVLQTTALRDARAFVRRLAARRPIAESRGMCTWSMVGDMLALILPVVGTVDELETVADALRIVVGLTLDGERTGARMMIGDTLVCIHGEGGDDMVELTMTDGRTIEKALFALLPVGAIRSLDMDMGHISGH